MLILRFSLESPAMRRKTPNLPNARDWAPGRPIQAFGGKMFFALISDPCSLIDTDAWCLIPESRSKTHRYRGPRVANSQQLTTLKKEIIAKHFVTLKK